MNGYFIPAGLLLAEQQAACPAQLCWENFFMVNLLPVTMGNIVEGWFSSPAPTGLSTSKKAED